MDSSSISGYSYSFTYQLERGEIDTAATIRFHADLGIRAQELSDTFIRDDELPAIRAALAETGSVVSCYDIYCGFNGPNGGPPADQLAHAAHRLERCAALGARRALVIPAQIDERVDPTTIRLHYSDLLRHCLSTTRRLGLTLMTANLGSMANYCGTTEHIKGLVDAVGPELRVTYDVGNFLMAGQDSIAALEEVAPLVEHVHLKDWTIGPAGSEALPGGYPAPDGRIFYSQPLGDGVVKLAEALSRLRQLGYAGYLSLEYEGMDDPKAALRKGTAYLRRLLQAA